LSTVKGPCPFGAVFRGFRQEDSRQNGKRTENTETRGGGREKETWPAGNDRLHFTGHEVERLIEAVKGYRNEARDRPRLSLQSSVRRIGPNRKMKKWTSAPSFRKSTTAKSTYGFSWLWDGGIDVRLGDEMNGYLAEENVRTADEILPWLQEAIAHFFPDSTYAASLDPDLRSRAAHQLFRPPNIGATAICPHCGAPNASMMEELIAYVCRHCGEAVEAKPPKIQ
jgi:hypothetical protein